MKEKIFPEIMLTLLLTSVLALASSIQTARASGTIYIRADGSIDPSTAPIQQNGDMYTLTGNINTATDGIVIERNNTIIDGAGYTLQGQGAYDSKGITLSGRSNLTLRNIEIRAFYFGIWFSNSSNNNIVGSNVTRNQYGFLFGGSSQNNIAGNNIANNMSGLFSHDSSYINIVGNNITMNGRDGISLGSTFNSSITGNNITAKGDGIYCVFSSNNNISENKIASNGCGIFLGFASSNRVTENKIAENTWPGIYFKYSSNNKLFHNNFINNGLQIYNEQSVNTWDDGYPSGGNYWSDYTGVDDFHGPYQNETGSDGIGDSPYIIDENNRDYFPFMTPIPRVPWDVTGSIEWISDNKCDIRDIAAVAKLFGSVVCDRRYDRRADITGPAYLVADGKIDIRDIALIAKHFGETH